MFNNQLTSRVVTVKDLATYLRCHQSTIYRLIKTADLPAFKIGSDWRFMVADIDRWCHSRTARQLDQSNASAEQTQ